MKVSLILKNILDILGPGNRLIVFISEKHNSYKANENLSGIDYSKYDGITIIGEEPFDQYKNLCELVDFFSEYTNDILIYTDYNLNDLLSKYPNIQEEIFNKISVLVNGKYIAELDKNERLRKSINQSITCFKPQYFKLYNSFNQLTRVKYSIKIDDKIYNIGLQAKGFIF